MYSQSMGALFLLLAFSQTTLAASTKINGVTYNAEANKTETGVATDLSRTPDTGLALKKIFLFPSVDDLSGILSPRLDEKLVQLFSRNSRFDLVRDSQVLRALSPEDGAYAKAAGTPAVHREAAKVTGSDTTVVLRTRSVGNETEMTLEFRDASGEMLFMESGSIPSYSPMENRWGLIEKLFRAVLSRLPFDGTITGRSAGTVTIDLGGGAIRRGEEFDVVRIVSVQRHPLLKTVVGTDYVRVGRGKVTSVDRSLSFAEIIEEPQGEMISVGAKILRSKKFSVTETGPAENVRPMPPFEEFQAKKEEDPFEDRLRGDFDERKARYGAAGLNLQYGSLTHTQTPSGGQAAEYSGSGLGGGIDGELWITKNWILSLGYGFQNASLSGSGSTLGDASWNKIELMAGYRFFPIEMGEGTQLTGSLGYQAMDFEIPTPAGTLVSGKKFSGPVIRLSGEILFHRNHRISGGFGFQPFSSFTDSGASIGSPDGGTVISFGLGWNYRLSSSFWTRVGFDFDSASGNYTNSSSVNDKRFAIGPGIYYSF